jgi:cell division protein FtsW
MTTTNLDFSKRGFFAEKDKPKDATLWKQILAIVAGLLAFGAVEVFSASRYQGEQLKGNLYYFGIIHLAFVAASIVVMGIVNLIPSTVWRRLTWLFVIAIQVSLIAVFFFPGENGASRWIPIPGTGFGFQPSEFAKMASILLGAHIFTKIDWSKDKTYKAHLQHFAVQSIFIVLILFTILIEPDLGNVMVISVAYLTMYLLSNSKWKKADLLFFAVVGIGVVAAAIIAAPYRLDRVTTQVKFLQTGVIEDEFGKGLQLRNILIGVGSGGLLGKGIGESRLKQGYFVEVTAFTDSIAAVIFEELGFILSILFVGAYIYLFLLIVKTAENQKDPYQRLVTWGIAMWFITQTFLHFGANVALIPVKGITLPFISYGGTSLLSFAVAMGIVIRSARVNS